MRKQLLLILAFAIVLILLLFWAMSTKIIIDPLINSAMMIKSSSFEHNQLIPSVHTCDGENARPSLTFEGIPAEAKSLVLIVDDPDAPAGTWTHWLLWNIPPRTFGIDGVSLPAGAIEGVTSFGRTGWGGPCPPSGTHHYHFRLYALNKVLAIPSTARQAELEQEMQGNIIDQSQLIGLYARTR